MAISQTRQLDSDPQSYKDYSQDHEYAFDGGLVVVPIASRLPGHRVIRLHGGVGTRRVRWTASRGGRPPVIPVPRDTNGDTLLSYSVTPQLPQINTQDQSYDWTVSGEYLYVQDTNRVPGENALPAGNHPFAVFPQAALAAELVPPQTMTEVYAGNRADTQTEYAVDELGPDNVSHVSWPFTILPAAYSSTHIIGG